MGGGKKGQRTKGNAQPSSSSRAAESLEQDGRSGFIGFAALGGNSLGYVPQKKDLTEDVGEVEVDAEIRMIFQKMKKKDNVTRLKAVQEFRNICKDKDPDVVKSFIPFWPRMYNKLAMDFDHRVREAVQQAHLQVALKAGRNLAPHLKLLIGTWLMSHFDTYAPAASAAAVSFAEVFPGPKQVEAVLFCRVEILRQLCGNLLNESPDTLSDPKLVPVEERDAKYARVVSSSMLALEFFIKSTAGQLAENSDENGLANLKELLSCKAFWKFSKHKAPLIRSSFYALLPVCCQKLRDDMLTHLDMLAPAVLSSVDEQEPIVVKPLWDAVLVLITTFKESWSNVNPRKAVLPKLWALLKNTSFGNASVVYPNLLPLLSAIPEGVIGDGLDFYNQFFGSLWQGLLRKQDILSAFDSSLMITSYMECLHYAMKENIRTLHLAEGLAKSLLLPVLRECFGVSEVARLWPSEFFRQLHKLLRYFEAHPNGKGDDHHRGTGDDQSVMENPTMQHGECGCKNILICTWGLVYSTLFSEDSGVIKFQSELSKCQQLELVALFVDVLLGNVTSGEQKRVAFSEDLTQATRPASSRRRDLRPVNRDEFLVDGYRRELLSKALASFLYSILKLEDRDVEPVFSAFASKVLTMETAKHILKVARSLTAGFEEVDTMSDLVLCKTLFTNVIAAMLGTAASQRECVAALAVSVLDLLGQAERVEYLDHLLQFEGLSLDTIMLLVAELFARREEPGMQVLLSSQVIRDKLVYLCKQSHLAGCGEPEGSAYGTRVWEIVRTYIEVLNDDLHLQAMFCDKVVSVVKVVMDSCVDEEGPHDWKSTEAALSCFASMASRVNTVTGDFVCLLLGIWKVVLRKQNEAIVNPGMKAFVAGLRSVLDKDGLTVDFFAQLETPFFCQVDASGAARLVIDVASNLMEVDKTARASRSFLERMMQPMRVDGRASDHSLLSSSGCLYFVSLLRGLLEEHLDIFNALNSGIVFDSLNLCLLSSHQAAIDAQYDQFSSIFKDFLAFLCKGNPGLFRTLFDEFVSRSIRGEPHSSLILMKLLLVARSIELLSEEWMTGLVKSLEPLAFTDVNQVGTYCLLLDSVGDISHVRGIVQKVKVDIECLSEVTAEPTSFASMIKLLTAALRRWWALIRESASFDEYADTVAAMMSALLKIKDGWGEYFACDVATDAECIVQVNGRICALLGLVVQVAAASLKKEQWDYVLCGVASWIQNVADCVDSLEKSSSGLELASYSCQAFYAIAKIFDARVAGVPSLMALDQASPSLTHDLIQEIVPCQVTDEMATEWQEFFAPTLFRSVYSLVLKLSRAEGWVGQDLPLRRRLIHDACCCVGLMPTSLLSEVLLEGRTSEADQKNALASFSEQTTGMMRSDDHCLQVAGFQLAARVASRFEEKLCEDQAEDEEKERARLFPESLSECMIVSRDETLVALSSKHASIDLPVEEMDDPRHASSLLAYLLSWQLILRIFRLSPLSSRAGFANYFHHNCHVNDLMTCLFCVLPKTVKDKDMSSDFSLSASGLHFSSLQKLAYHVFLSALESIPALTRTWFNNDVDRRNSGIVSKFISAYASPVLIRNEFARIESSPKTFANMSIKTRVGAREIVAAYSIEEISMELLVQLAENHPLTPVAVDSGKRIGVANSQWRQWMLQLAKFLSWQNGSILDGLLLWKRNVDKRFEGVEECTVCYSVIHGSNYSLPSTPCKTCRKKFHPACLYKWFKSSNKSTCPLCRNDF